MAKVTLNSNNIADKFFEGQLLLAIAAPMVPDYRFCWMLNHYFDLSFKRAWAIDILMIIQHSQKTDTLDLFSEIAEQPKAEFNYFPVYCHEIANSELSIVLYGNKTGDKKLVREMAVADYFILIPNNPYLSELEKINTCKQLEGVTWIKEVNPKDLSSRESLIL